jgi:alpha-tubulin suppressor-like RCC1 family protein
MANSSVPVPVSGVTGAAAIATGGYETGTGVCAHTCAIVGSGSVLCWGDNYYGELGNGTTTNSSVPVTVSGITNATAVATGTTHTCALLGSSTVQCWGNNFNGELGNGTTTNSSVPVTVSGVASAAAIT